ncbi:MAG TPA: hypothetical protein VFC63_24645 [Blastocatellia bacterium]|nr:hypothetical protein [Blastocatellia bacterium]
MEQFSDERTMGGNRPLLKFAQRFSLLAIATMVLTAAANGQQMPDFASRVKYTLPVTESAGTQPGSSQTQTDKTKDSQASDGTGKQEEKKEPTDEKAAVKVNIITDSAMTSSLNYKPITKKQRWQLYLAQDFTTPGAYLGVILSAGLDQAGNDPPQWGQGASGYAKRFASRFATNVVQGSIQSAGSYLLKEDPRYISSSRKGFLPRAGHALIFGVLTYNNEGHVTPAIANIGSYYAASMISTAWIPGHSTIKYGLEDGSEQLALGAAFNLVQEFWPDMMRLLKRK